MIQLLALCLAPSLCAWGQGPSLQGTDLQGKPLGDGRRTNARFLSNLGRNSLSMFGRGSLTPFLTGAAATGLAAPWDDDVRGHFEPERRAQWLGEAASEIGKPYVIGPAAAAVYGLGRASGNQRFRDLTYDLAQVTIVAASFTTAVKVPTRRLRPDGSDRLSFVSGHTSNAFAWATVGTRHYGAKWGVPAFLWAGLVGLGRIEKNRHYLSDVVGGATLGTLAGLACTRAEGDAPRRRATVTMAPLRSASHDGVGLGMHVAF